MSQAPLTKKQIDGLSALSILNPVRFQSHRFLWFTVIIIFFSAILCAARLSSAIKVGADEDYELSKALLYARGFHFYTEIWNDQPLLHTALVANILKQSSPSVLGPRCITAGFSLVLVFSLFLLAERIIGSAAAGLTAIFTITSPGFVDLSGSCMVEIPGLSAAVGGLAALLAFRRSNPLMSLILSGVFFGIAVEIKLIGLILLPLVALIICLMNKEQADSTASAKPKRTQPNAFDRGISTSLFFNIVLFFAVLVGTFVVINFLLRDSYLHHLDQTWSGHFARTKSFEYGSSQEYPFDWTVLLKNWDQTIPAVIGIGFCLKRARQNNWLVLPTAWFFLELVVFGMHKPWWSYYYVHNAIPTCWCAAIGFVAALNHVKRKNPIATVGVAVFAIAAAMWMGSRVYLQIRTIRHSPQTFNSLVLREIQRFKPFTEFMFTDEGVYSFHAGIPLPPKLAVLSLKRFWSGDMTNDRLRSELWNAQPGIILLKSTSEESPYQDLLRAKYSLVYNDQKHILYARKDLAKQAKW